MSFCLLLVAMSVVAATNEVKVGTATLNIKIEGLDTTALSNSTMWVGTSPLFGEVMESREFEMNRNGNLFSLDVPVELEEEIAGIRFECNGGGFGSMITLSQSQPTESTFKLNEDLQYAGYEANKPDLSPEQWNALGESMMRFYMSEDCVPDSLYESWQDVRAYENDVMFPSQLQMAMEGLESQDWVPDWFVNSLKCRFASIQTIPYVKAAEAMNGLAVDEPPMESYSFLNGIDYSDNFLKRLPYTGLKSFLYALLRFPEGGFGKIGESDVNQWKEATRIKLLPAISEPTSLLLDLLAAMSFVEQIDIDQNPLSEKQICNVKAGLGDGLAQILLDKNAHLVKVKSKESALQNLVGTSFNLQQYIDKMYPGQPVIVDNWATWCAPCLDAMGKIKAYRKDTDTSDIAFINLCSESSPIEKWKNVAVDFDADQIRISEEDFRQIGEQYDLSALPAYLIFNSKHELIDTLIGIPTRADFENWIKIAKQ